MHRKHTTYTHMRWHNSDIGQLGALVELLAVQMQSSSLGGSGCHLAWDIRALFSVSDWCYCLLDSHRPSFTHGVSVDVRIWSHLFPILGSFKLLIIIRNFDTAEQGPCTQNTRASDHACAHSKSEPTSFDFL